MEFEAVFSKSSVVPGDLTFSEVLLRNSGARVDHRQSSVIVNSSTSENCNSIDLKNQSNGERNAAIEHFLV